MDTNGHPAMLPTTIVENDSEPVTTNVAPLAVPLVGMRVEEAADDSGAAEG